MSLKKEKEKNIRTIIGQVIGLVGENWKYLKFGQ